MNITELANRQPEIYEIARPIYVQDSIRIDPANPRFHVVGGLPAAPVGQWVYGIGKTSGLENMQVRHTCRHILLEGHLVLCQDDGWFLVFEGGDSGGPIFDIIDWETSEVLMLGIYRGHAWGIPFIYFWSPMSQIYLAYPGLLPLVE